MKLALHRGEHLVHCALQPVLPALGEDGNTIIQELWARFGRTLRRVDVVLELLVPLSELCQSDGVPIGKLGARSARLVSKA